jgi:biopolymer transport protein ExbD
MAAKRICPQCGLEFRSTAAGSMPNEQCPQCSAERAAAQEDPDVPAVHETPAYDLSGGGLFSAHDALLLPPGLKHPEDLIDMTSMVDIVFFVLIFFMATSMQALESVMDVPPPKPQMGAAGSVRSLADYLAESDSIEVKIEADDSIWVDGVQTSDELDLRMQLRRSRDTAPESAAVTVLGDADASHGAAVTVFDACADVNLDNIRFGVQEKDGLD